MKAFLTELREHTGQWAKLPTSPKLTENGASTKASQVRQGKVNDRPVFKPGEYQAAYDQVDGVWTIWARYVGTPEEG